MARNSKEDFDRIHRKAEAMYYKNCSTSEIAYACGVSKIEALELTQLIFGRNMRKRERA